MDSVEESVYKTVREASEKVEKVHTSPHWSSFLSELAILVLLLRDEDHIRNGFLESRSPLYMPKQHYKLHIDRFWKGMAESLFNEYSYAPQDDVSIVCAGINPDFHPAKYQHSPKFRTAF